MLSRSSFKAELVAFRASRKPPLKPGDAGPLGIGNRNSTDLRLIDRWLHHPDTEKVWKTIQRAAIGDKLLSSADFIRFVLQARRKAKASVNRIYGATWKGPSSADLAAIRHRAPSEYAIRVGLQHFPGLNDEWAALRERLASDLSVSNIELLEAAHSLHLRYLQLVDQHGELSPKDHDGTRVLRLFWKIVGDYLKPKFGKWFDKEVAALTEIAFALGAGTVAPTKISDARKKRSKKVH